MYETYDQWLEDIRRRMTTIPRSLDTDSKTVQVGEKLYVTYCGEPDCSVVVTESNKQWIEYRMNDTLNDISDYLTLDEMKVLYPEYISDLDELFPLQSYIVPEGLLS